MPIGRLKQALKARLGERGGLLHSVGTLVGGTAVAQGLAVLALPLLTRLYTPAEFSVLAVYASLLGILTVVACLRLEIAIPLPERDEDAASLLALSLASGLALSLLVALGVLLFHGQITAALRVPAFSPYIWMVPVGMWLASAYAAFQFWSTRKKKFPRIARTRMTQALGGVGLQGIAGALGAGPLGLLLGHMFSGGAGFVGLARDAWKHDRAALRTVTPASMRAVLRQYSRFPKYSALEALANTAGSQVPVILIAALAIGPEAGYLMLATRVMAAPMSLVGGSVAQVFLAHAPEELRAGRLGEFTARVLGGLLKTGVGPLMFAALVAEPLARILLGEKWARSGELVAWLAPWFILQFLASPVSMVMHVQSRQKALLGITIIGFLMRAGLVYCFSLVTKESLPEIYAISGATFYFVCCLVFYGASGVGVMMFISEVGKALRILSGWLFAGILIRWGLGI